MDGDGEGARAEDEVGVGCCSGELLDGIGMGLKGWEDVPEWVADYEECDVDVLGVVEDGVAG